jgi:hypothetical protein
VEVSARLRPRVAGNGREPHRPEPRLPVLCRARSEQHDVPGRDPPRARSRVALDDERRAPPRRRDPWIGAQGLVALPSRSAPFVAGVPGPADLEWDGLSALRPRPNPGASRRGSYATACSPRPALIGLRPLLPMRRRTGEARVSPTGGSVPPPPLLASLASSMSNSCSRSQ